MIVRLLAGVTSHAEEYTIPLSLIGLGFYPHPCAQVNRKAVIGDSLHSTLRSCSIQPAIMGPAWV